MRRQDSTLTRYGLALFGGYVALFLVRHYPIPKEVPGLPAFWPSGYRQIAAQWNPVQQINMLLSVPLEVICSIEILIVLAVLFLVYFQSLRAPRNRQHGKDGIRAILLWTALFSLPLLFLPFMLSRDIYSYIIYGRMAAIYGDNPAISAPIAYPTDPFFQYLIMWKDTPSVYGPVWTLFSEAVTYAAEAAGGGAWWYLLIYKLTMICAHLISVTLIWRILAFWKQTQQVWGTLLYAWNPVALIEFAGSAHNDVLMICLMLVAIYCAQRNYWRRAIVALVAAALVKWIAVILLPMYMLMILARPQPWATRVLRAGQMAAIAIVMVGLLYLPYGDVPRSLGAPVANQAAMRAENSLGVLLIKGVGLILSKAGAGEAGEQAWRSAAGAALAAGSKVLFLLAWLVGLYAIWRRPTFERFLQSGAWLFVTLLLVAAVFRVWYVTWPLALAALLEWRRIGLVACTFAAGAPFVYLDWGSNNWFGALVFLPVIVVLAYQCYQAFPVRWRNLSAGYHKSIPPLDDGR